jgi:hypothetical protein
LNVPSDDRRAKNLQSTSPNVIPEGKATVINKLVAWHRLPGFLLAHDWFHHTTPRPGNELKIPLDKERNDSWPEDPMRIRRTPADRRSDK